MKFIIKILCLIWVLFFPVVGFAQGQITRPKPPITRPTPRDPSTHNGKGSSKKQGTSNSHRRNNKGDKTKVFIDLGLPSGTLWRDANETDDYFTYEEAVNRFGDKLPTKEQMEELKDKCQWTWNGNGYKVTGPNGNSIVLPAAGCRGCNGSVGSVGSAGFYWSSTPGGSEGAWRPYFYSGYVGTSHGDRCSGRSVRLVQD